MHHFDTSSIKNNRANFSFFFHSNLLYDVFRTLFSCPKALSALYARLMFLAFYSYKKGVMWNKQAENLYICPCRLQPV